MILNLSYIIIFFSLLVTLLNNPINALFSLAACYFFSAILLLVLNMEFLALILIIVYIGALLMLFLFILMLSNIKEVPRNNNNFYFNIASNTFTFYIICSLLFFLTKFLNITNLSSNLQHIYNFEYLYTFTYFFKYDIDCFIFLYTDFFVWFFLITLILFISIISSLFLLTNKKIN